MIQSDSELDALLDELEDLRNELREIKGEWYSPEEHQLRLRREIEEVEDSIQSDWRLTYGPVSTDAHSLLSDLAWRATTGEPTAQAIEREVGELLKRVRDLAV